MNKEKELKIKELYLKGETIKNIKNLTGCSSDLIYTVRDKYKLPKRGRNNKLEPTDINKIIEMYNSGVILSKICKECRVSTNTVSKILVKNNIPFRSEGHIRTNKDFSKFYDLTNPETQYWIGYICADGNIVYNVDKGAYRVSLFSKDKEVIDKFIKFCGKDMACVHTNSNGVIGALINSKELSYYFINTLNIPPNKSLILNPNLEYTSNFILGYFDGDGCIRNSSEKQVRYECNITCGSKIFIDKIKEVLDIHNIYSIIYKHPECNAYKIRIDRKEESRKFYKYLYTNMVVCLSRKLNNFVALFGNIEDNNSVNCGNT